MLVDSQIDHTTGLLLLREGEPLKVYCTRPVYQDLTTGFPVFKILEHYCGVEWREVDFESRRPFVVPEVPHLELTALALKSKAPPYSPHRHDPHPGDTIGLILRDTTTGGSAFYSPGLGEAESHVLEAMRSVDCVLVDGTFWRDDELELAGIASKRGREMGHLAQSGPGGMIDLLDSIEGPRKVLIHINNTNPILDENSAERGELERHGIEVAFDGMEIEITGSGVRGRSGRGQR